MTPLIALTLYLTFLHYTICYEFLLILDCAKKFGHILREQIVTLCHRLLKTFMVLLLGAILTKEDAMTSIPIIQFNHVTKQYDNDPVVLDNVSFEIERGKFYTLLGPSGCGKTTILRLIAGFTEPSEGDIYFNGEKINNIPANKRQVNTVFQDYALFPTFKCV